MRHSMGGMINGRPLDTAPVVRKPEPIIEEIKVSPDKDKAPTQKTKEK